MWTKAMPDHDMISHEIDCEALVRIGPICDAFEAAFIHGTDPLIEDYLAKGNELDRRGLLLELLKLDREYRAASGTHLAFRDYLARFPNDEDCLLAAWTEADTIDSASVGQPSPQPDTRELPRRIGNYELQEVLGQGGMGVVYRAVQYAGDTPIREVALKLIRIDQWFGVEDKRNGQLLARFREETRFASQLEHPNIIRVYDIGQMDGLDYFSMQIINGTDLALFVQKQSPSFNRIAEMLIPIARAIAFAHAKGIVHRDLKPSNILIDQRGKPYIADFGLAKSTFGNSDLTQTGQILGTPGYMAPEQASGEHNEVGPSADIYGLGGLLYYCLTGQAPFVAANVLDALVKVLESDPIPPRTLNVQISRSLEQVCMRCLEKKAEDRYETALEVAEDLERFASGLPTHAKAPTVIERLRRFGRRSPVLATHIGAIGLVLLLGQVQFALSAIRDVNNHLQVTSLTLGWIAMSLLLGVLSRSKKKDTIVATFWLCMDAVFLTAVISTLCSPSYPPDAILIGYPMIVVGGGMFFQARMVVLVTIASMLSYVVMLVLERYMLSSLFQHATFLILLACIGICSLHNVRRFRMLSYYIESTASQANGPLN